MSIAAIVPPAVVYREEQNFGWWVYVLLAVMAGVSVLALSWDDAPWAEGVAGQAWAIQMPLIGLVGMLLPSVLVVGVLRMTTEVTPAECRVWFGWVPTYRFALAVESIQGVEVVRYRPLADCGGWGIRRHREGGRVLNARGDRGVRLLLTDGSRVLIGSQRPEALARALEQAIRPEG